MQNCLKIGGVPLVILILLLFISGVQAWQSGDILIQPDSLEFIVCHNDPLVFQNRFFLIENSGPYNYEFKIDAGSVPYSFDPEDPHEGHLGPFNQVKISIASSADNHGNVLEIGDYEAGIDIALDSWDGGELVYYDMPVLIHVVSCSQVPEFPLLSLSLVIVLAFIIFAGYREKFK